ncbi:MAG TPA: SDR family oxidoreductase [Stellaceae bacterium]|jgi:NAD(P)-dependent dehydrogenase (short-subunit alcohol dehydrogenase family)
MSSAKIALVTGAGSGIGRAVALALMNDGYSVVLAGRRREPLEAVARESENGFAVPADVTDPVSVAALFAAIEQRFGRLDLLFNNAGVNAPAVPIEELPVAKWHEVIAANVTGVFLCTRAAFALMKDQKPRGGRIINNGSIGAHTPRPNTAPYTAAKHAVLGLTKSTALDGRQYDIACGQIDIGNADTGWADKFKQGVVQADGRIAAEPVLDLEHVAKAVLTMASLPLDANILAMTLMATKMPFVGRG